MKLDDVMTTQEAAERWNVTADALERNCRGRVKNGFLEGEFRKSGKNVACNASRNGKTIW